MNYADDIKSAVSMREVCNKYGFPVSRSGYICCPFHAEKTASLHVYDGDRGWFCFGCGEGGDVISFVSRLFGLTFTETLSKMNSDFNLGLPLGETRRSIMDELAAIRRHLERRAEREERERAEAERISRIDFTEYFKHCRGLLRSDWSAAAYYHGRGLSEKLARQYWFGFDPATNCLIVPVSRRFYIARNINPESQQRYLNPSGVPVDLFNKRALFTDNPVFATEGIFDALSVIEVGFNAIALNSTSNTKMLLEELRTQTACAPLILCLDNDEGGARATDELVRGLRELGVPFIVGDICGAHKDANEALVADRAAFTDAVRQEELKMRSMVIDHKAHTA